MDLKNKTIIITGASSGIGAAAALLFARHGANVVLGARRAAELDQIAGQIRQSNGQATALAGDVTDESYAQKLVDHAKEVFGGLDGAFNNAGMVGDMVPVSEMSSQNWQDVIATNLTSAFYLAKAQVPAMQSGGALVFTSSFVGYSNAGLPGMSAYAAAKAGLIGFVQSLANEHAQQGIRVNALLPGGTKTAMAGDDPEGHALINGLHPMRRMAQPEEIAQAAMFLLSERASFVTGAPMLVDGGVSVQLG
ncbi:SDR family oxidoreductase [uncultured Pelagimonas sp.]|uniref:SDR family oxidoreductase n=1 Tax=uncultured Pelagimonas sp. TaxID=1618102 RepID=UPI00263795CE|nr:SDR family oxidoreductase [uncultured Pelagimonas sp.]